jgi:hypothetical protein
LPFSGQAEDMSSLGADTLGNAGLRDPLGVRAGACFVASKADHVSIGQDAIVAFCGAIARDSQFQFPEWETGYHFVDGGELTIAYIFVLDTINFCFWGDPKWRRPYNGQYLDGYWALAAALTQEVQGNPNFLDASKLATLDAAVLGRVLDGKPTIPLLEERAVNLRELGRWIAERFHGRFSNVLEAISFDAIELVRLLVGELSSFRDEAVYKGRGIRFYKRAQILAADLYGAFQGKGWGKLSRVQELTAFADYKVPQILRHYGILRYSETLAAKVDNFIELEAGASEEVEIRASAIWAVELMRQQLGKAQIDIPSHRIDWLLWSNSQSNRDMGPHHRILTVYY